MMKKSAGRIRPALLLKAELFQRGENSTPISAEVCSNDLPVLYDVFHPQAQPQIHRPPFPRSGKGAVASVFAAMLVLVPGLKPGTNV
jgi:hypothetical protein